MNIKFRFLLFFVICIISVEVNAQTNCTVSIKNEEVMINGQKSGTVKNKTYNKYTVVYDYSGVDGKKISEFSISAMENQKTIYVTFPQLNCSYNFHQKESVLPEFIIIQWCSNGILSGGKLNKDALKTWCNKNNINLDDREVATSAKQNQPSTAAPTLQVKNNCKKLVVARLVIQTKYGSTGLTMSFHSSSVTPVSAKVGDELCIMNDLNQTVSCITIKAGLKNISINQSGTFFEEK